MIDKLAVLEEVGQLTTTHMSMKINIEKLLLDDYPNAHLELAILLTQGYYNRIQQEHDGDTSPPYQARALDRAKWFTINRLTTHFPALIERSTLFMLTDAEESGWYRSDWFGYSDLTELLSSFSDAAEEGTTTWYDWNFIVTKMLPACEMFGVPASDIMSASCQVKKLRGAVPATRDILKRNEAGALTDKQARNDLKWLMGVVGDPQVTYSSMREEVDFYQGKLLNRVNPTAGEKYILPDGRTLFVIEVTDMIGERTIEQALNNRVNFKLEDLGKLFRRTSRLMKDGGDT